MNHTSAWIFTNLPPEIINIIEETAQDNIINSKIHCNSWIGGFLWHYIRKFNNENFKYDINDIECDGIEYIEQSTGDSTTWRNDILINSEEDSETVRKLSFILQLSDHDSYEGGNVQIMNQYGQTYFFPRIRGTIIVFDSRSQYRICKIKSGTRKSLAGCVTGPRWR